ncbi:hypothetical protein [Fenollaria massiliensis]|uniref:Uncharacterized protein n=1 Tax=Fenollaria massiliensis TaxID=938288 RepID=A0A9E7IXC1_9FIRM|nr:hypothetical protein [Fenollaria massiliensis]UQK59740.1 hypothetical protein M1R53_03600 [Fenollaria massiliensis]
MDGLFVLAFLFVFISSISTVLKEANKKKQNDELDKKIEDIYKRTMQDNNKNKKPNKIKKDENVKKIGNLEKHYDEAIRDDYKEMAEDYFSDKRRKLDEYLSRDIKDRLREYKENKEIKLNQEKEEKIDLLNTEENCPYNQIESEEIGEKNIQFSRNNLAKSIVIKEILDKPLALRRINE